MRLCASCTLTLVVQHVCDKEDDDVSKHSRYLSEGEKIKEEREVRGTWGCQWVKL